MESWNLDDMSVGELDVKKPRHCPSCTCNSAIPTQDKSLQFLDGRGSVEQIDAEMRRLDALVYRLRKKRNELQPVGRLSPDILMVIFRLVQEAERELGNPLQAFFDADGTFAEDMSDADDVARYHQQRRGAWLYVSSAWYSFATQAPSLWTTLSLNQPMFINKLALTYSQCLPLDVRMCLDNAHQFLEPDWKSILINNASRLRTIDLSALEPEVDKILFYCVIPYMPELRTLQLDDTQTSGKFRTAGKIHAPNLHRLVLSNGHIAHHLPLLQTAVALKTLDLFIGNHCSLTFDVLHNLITCFRALECLSVRCDNDLFGSSNLPALSLPNLSQLHIIHCATGCLALLKLFNVPDSCRIDVTCEFDTPIPLATLLGIRQMLFAFAKPHLTIQTGEDFLIRFQNRKDCWTLLPGGLKRDYRDTIACLDPLFTSLPATSLAIRNSSTSWARKRPLNALQLLTALVCGESGQLLLPELASLRLLRLAMSKHSVGEIAAAAARVLEASADPKYEGLHNMRELIIREYSEVVDSTACGFMDLKPMGVKLTWGRSMMEKDSDDEELM